MLQLAKFVCGRSRFETIKPVLKIFKRYASDAKFDTKPYQLHKLTKGPPSSATLTVNDAIYYYKQMQTIRRMENNCANLYKEKAIRGFCHLYAGEEAVAVGIKAALHSEDKVITAYRAHGWTYLMGVSVFELISELIGKSPGCSKGKGGSMHTYGKNFFGGNGIVGAQVPLGAGLAFIDYYKNVKNVSVTCYGDGAANQGQVAEAFNMAMLWKLPCIFVCENNGYGMGTSADRAAVNTAYYTRGDVIPGIWVDGMDVITVREAARFAVEHCNSGNGPILIEAATYRYFGHSMSDPGTSYRSRDEIQKIRQSKDPIIRFKESIIGADLVKEDDIKKIDNEIKKEVDEATEKAKNAKVPEIGELFGDVYCNIIERDLRNVLPWNPAPTKNTNTPLHPK